MTWYKDGKAYSASKLRDDYLPTLLPSQLKDEHYLAKGAKRLVVRERPVYNPETHNGYSQIEYINGEPTKTWTVEARPQEEIDAKVAAQAEQAAMKADGDTVKADAQVRALLRASPAQIENYIENNVSNMAEAKTALATIAKAVSLLMQSHLRDE